MTSKQELKPSFGLWVPIIWYATEASQSITRWVQITYGYQGGILDIADGSPIDRAFASCILAIGIIILMTRRIQWRQLARSNGWLVAMFLYMLVSTLWSDFQEVSVKRWIRCLVDVVMVLVVVTESGSLEAECTLLRRVMYIHFPLSIIFIKYLRKFGTAWDDFGNEMWVGITSHKNVLGGIVMTGAIYFIFELVRNRADWKKKCIYIAYLLMALWLLKGSSASRSNTAIMLLFVGVALLFALHFVKSRIAHPQQLIIFFILILVPVISSIVLLEVFGQSVVAAGIEVSGRDSTLTGRTDLWSDVLKIAHNSPIFGVGYGSFWIGNTHNLWAKHFWGPTQGHNGYIDVYLELGIIGLLLLAGLVISAYRSVLRLLADNFEYGAIHFTWLTVVLLYNITESSFLRGGVDMWFLFLLAAINMPRRNVVPVSAGRSQYASAERVLGVKASIMQKQV